MTENESHPMSALRPPLDPQDEDRARLAFDAHERIERTPAGRDRLGRFTVVCLILNRTIGSGIFVTPALIVRGPGSVGFTLLLWLLGGLVATCGLLTWLELGLSLPFLPAGPDKRLRPVPRSGGEKNYFEFIYKSERTGRPRYLVRCIFGIPFLLLLNLSGNSIAFGIYFMNMVGQPNPAQGSVIAVAIAALTFTVLLHIFSRQIGIWASNIFAVIKVILLLAIIVLGWAKAAGNTFGGAPKATSNFDTDKSFSPLPYDFASFTNSCVYVLYSYSGYKQPFYVLAEVKRPRKVFPKYTLIAMAIATTLFVLVNVSYFCAVPKDLHALDEQRNMAIVFFGQMFGDNAAKRVMAGIISFSIFGNLLVSTFTAAKVKQEIAKEGILPFSLKLATSHRTPFAMWKASRRGSSAASRPEQTPMAALGLHLLDSVFLIAITAMLSPTLAYGVLVTLNTYVIVLLNGFFGAAGLLYLNLKTSRRWNDPKKNLPNFKPKGGMIYSSIYCFVCGFLLIAAFAPPSEASPYSYEATGIKWFIVPLIGASAPLWGVLWYAGLRIVMIWRGRELVVTRDPTPKPDEEVKDQYLMDSERITHQWRVI